MSLSNRHHVHKFDVRFLLEIPTFGTDFPPLLGRKGHLTCDKFLWQNNSLWESGGFAHQGVLWRMERVLQRNLDEAWSSSWLLQGFARTPVWEFYASTFLPLLGKFFLTTNSQCARKFSCLYKHKNLTIAGFVSAHAGCITQSPKAAHRNLFTISFPASEQIGCR